MSQEFELRLATPADLPGIIALERKAFTAPRWTKADYAKFIGEDGKERCLIVGFAGDGLAGFAAASLMGEDGELESVAVDAAYQRQGLGKLLCRNTVAWCQEAGAQRMFLEVRTASAGVQQLYRAIGFVEVGIRPKYYRNPEDDALVMRLDLAGRVREAPKV